MDSSELKKVVQIKEINNCQVVELYVDKYDIYESSHVLEYIEEKLKELGYPDIIVDLSNVRQLDSSGVGSLIALQNILKKKNRKMPIVSNNDTIIRILRITKMIEYFDFFTTMDEAFQLLKERQGKQL